MAKNVKATVRMTRPPNKGGLWRVVRIAEVGGMTVKTTGKGKSYREALDDALEKELAFCQRKGIKHPLGKE